MSIKVVVKIPFTKTVIAFATVKLPQQKYFPK